MITYLLKRVSMTDLGTFGVLIDENNIPFVLTLELPWKDNKHDVSCIPAGTYKCVRIDSPLHGDCFKVTGVPDRDFIEIHIANVIDDLKGCIALGEKFSYNIKHGLPGVAASGEGFLEFMAKLKGENEFSLRIVEV